MVLTGVAEKERKSLRGGVHREQKLQLEQLGTPQEARHGRQRLDCDTEKLPSKTKRCRCLGSESTSLPRSLEGLSNTEVVLSRWKKVRCRYLLMVTPGKSVWIVLGPHYS